MGLKFECPINFPTKHKEVELEIRFRLNLEEIRLQGNLRWKKNYGKVYLYGLEIKNKKDVQEILISELKTFSNNVLLNNKKMIIPLAQKMKIN